MQGQSPAGFGHLHQRQHAFLHARARGCRDDDHAAFLRCGLLDRTSDFFTDHRSHRAGEKTEVHDRDHRRHAFDAQPTGDHRVVQSAALALLLDLFAVVGKAQRIGGYHVGVGFLEAPGIGEILDALARSHQKMMTAGRTDVEVLFEIQLVQHRVAGRTLGPHAFGHVIAFVLRTKSWFVKNSHDDDGRTPGFSAPCGGILPSHDRYDNYVFKSVRVQNFRAFVYRRPGGEYVVDQHSPCRRILSQQRFSVSR